MMMIFCEKVRVPHLEQRRVEERANDSARAREHDFDVQSGRRDRGGRRLLLLPLLLLALLERAHLLVLLQTFTMVI
jgi:hypothetical protein